MVKTFTTCRVIVLMTSFLLYIVTGLYIIYYVCLFLISTGAWVFKKIEYGQIQIEIDVKQHVLRSIM